MSLVIDGKEVSRDELKKLLLKEADDHEAIVELEIAKNIRDTVFYSDINEEC